ncbi:MAG: hypothetical protein ACYSU7_00565, partial [Planctomycetota bacterium]
MSKSSSKPRRRWRKALLGLAALLIVLALLAAAAPTLVNLGLGQGAVAAALERRINGTVSFDRLGLGWFGSQTVTGLSMTGTDGTTVARLDVGVNTGLLALLTGGAEALEVDVSGALSGELRRDGSTSFEDLFAGRESRGDGDKHTGTKRRAPALLAGVGTTTVRFADLSVELRDLSDPEAPEAIVLNGLAGAFAYEPGGPVSLDLAGTTAGGSAPGSIVIALNGTEVFDGQGALTLDRAGVNLEINVRNVPVLHANRRTELRTLKLSASSDALAEQVAIAIEADAVIDGAETGRLDADLNLERPVQPDGTLTLDLGRITGRVTGKAVPTALLQRFFAGTPIVVTRDIGPVVDLEADFSSGDARNVSITAVADAARVEFSGVVDPLNRSISGEVLRLSAEVSPQLVADMTGLYTDRPAGVLVNVESFSIPPQGGEAGDQLAGIAVAGTLELTTPVSIAREPGAEPMMSVSSLNARFDSPALGEGTTVTGSAVIDESKASFDVSASGYLAEDGSFDFARATPVGTATMQGMSTATLARLVPQHAELIELAVDKPLDVTVVTAIEAGEPRAAITATSAEHEIALTVVRGAETLRVMDGRGNVTVTPALAAALQEGAEQPIALAEPARVRFDLEPFDLPAGGEFPATELKGRLEADRVDLEQVPGVAERVGVDAVVADVSVARAMSSVTLKGSAALRRAVADQPLAGARYELDLVNDGGTYAVRQVVLDLSDVVVRRAEHVLGRERGALWNWLGSRGNAHVSMDTVGDGFTAAIRADFENLRGE